MGDNEKTSGSIITFPVPSSAAGTCPHCCCNAAKAADMEPSPFDSPSGSDNLVSFEDSPGSGSGDLEVDLGDVEMLTDDDEDDYSWLKELGTYFLNNYDTNQMAPPSFDLLNFESYIFPACLSEEAPSVSLGLETQTQATINQTESRNNDPRPAKIRKRLTRARQGKRRRKDKPMFDKLRRPTPGFNVVSEGIEVTVEIPQKVPKLLSEVTGRPKRSNKSKKDIHPTLEHSPKIKSPKRKTLTSPKNATDLARLQTANILNWTLAPKEVLAIGKAESNGTGDDRYYIEAIPDVKFRKTGRMFCIKWLGWLESFNAWKHENELTDVADYNKTTPLAIFLSCWAAKGKKRIICDRIDWEDKEVVSQHMSLGKMIHGAGK